VHNIGAGQVFEDVLFEYKNHWALSVFGVMGIDPFK